KIYFCSRTHSQLNQVVKEVKKTKFADQLRVVTLGSRKTLCVNDRVSTLKSSNAINEACLQMQLKSSSKITKAKDGQRRKCPSKCPYFRPEAIQRLADIYIRDIEDLTAAGRRMAACPYYASRYAVAAAELVLLPYQMILHQTTRESCSLPLGGNVVIIDEAHNLLDALDEMYSSEVDGRLLELCSVQLDRYLGRYSKRLNAKNLVYVRQLSLVVANFLKYLKTNSDKKGDSQVMTINDFTFTTDTDAVNWFKVIRYVEKSQICRKMRGFALRFGEEVRTASDEGSGASGSMLPAAGCFDTLVSFLRAISGSSKDCRLIYFRGDQFVCGRLKIVCLNPAAHIRNVLDEAHSVILAGGTLEPVDELYDRLFDLCSIARSRISHFSCGHIVPKENLLPVIVCRGPRGGNMRFNYQTRTQPALMTELGQILISLATVVPGGVVCFFSSYGYLSAVCDALSSDSMLQELETLKRVFIEPKNASQVPSLLKEYAENVQMSEGINFSDDLGRCVAMIGLPYANVKSIELQTKVNFLNAMKLTDGKADRGKTYFSNLCFKAVNQSIGRAIRHSNDYASIVLIDSRFHENACQRKLPKWISDNLVEPPTFSECCVLLTSFYNNCRSRYAKETDTF
ncbi:unnamed protein product, partial [Soboliphyme baturini]|uniref:Helicase ATP-binding domain-containing protein n=1 Tax=Soboliphyme baturini TaxID=241478 RepID=A0A183J3P3_9BILA